MSIKPKKNPATSRKRVTALAQVKVSTRKIRKVNMVHEGSFIQQNHPVSTISTSSPNESQCQTSGHENESMLSILNQIQMSNQQLTDRLERLERGQIDAFVSAPTSLWPQTSGLSQGTNPVVSDSAELSHQPHINPRVNHHSSSQQGGVSPQLGYQQDLNLRSGATEHPRDAIMPSPMFQKQ